MRGRHIRARTRSTAQLRQLRLLSQARASLYFRPTLDHAGSQTSSLGFAYQSRGSTALFVILPTFAAPGIGFSGN
jgi:hypothetical protein